MLRLNPRVLIGAGVTGILGIGGYGIYAAVKKDETIYEFLTRKGFHFLNTDGSADDGGWGQKVEKHKTDNSGAPKLSGYTDQGNDKKTENIKTMKEICESLVREPAKDENKLKQAEKWCAKDKAPQR